MRNLLIASIALSSLTGCNAVLSATGNGWSTDVFTVEIGGIYDHALEDGEVIDLGWAAESNVACFPATENENFDGSHVFFGLVQPANSYMTVAATPELGLDISMYALQMPRDVFETPGGLTNTLNCDDAYDFEFDNNPGELEYIETLGYGDDINVLIGVAGAHGAVAGEFELEIYAEQAN